MWECMIGIEGVRSVPLEEWTVIWKGEKELQMQSFSRFFDSRSSHSLGLQARPRFLWRLARLLWDVAYLELLVDSLITQVPDVNKTESKISGVKRSILNVPCVYANT